VKTHEIWVAGTGVYVPPSREVAQSDTTEPHRAASTENNRWSRVAVAGDTSAPDMALAAARRALTAGRGHPADVGLLLYASVWHQGPDGWGPHYHLQRHLGLGHALALELRGGCTGVFGAIDLAAAHLQSRNNAETALIVCADNFGTKLVDRWCMGPLAGAVGDGGAAVLLSRSGGVAKILSSVTTTFAEMESVHREGEPIFPPSVTEGRYLDFGARAALFQQRAMAEGFWLSFVTGHQARVREIAEEALADAGTAPSEISRVIVNSMPRDTARDYLECFGSTVEKSSLEFTEGLGHMGAADHVVALHRMLESGELHRGDRVLLTGFSPGITYKAMVMEITGDGRV
jgi:clorobiocin biosynthesis protein CloN2